MGFADIVEKVKPAVISVRVKVRGRHQDDGLRGRLRRSAERRAFLPPLRHAEGATRDSARAARSIVTGQGSGFFISADGYAVTNNHVVDKAETVEVTTDDGKTYTPR
jgi:serine protease Do